MGLRINTNVPVLTALRWLSIHDREQKTSLERLASGLRINRGADDPSGLIISEQLRAQISALEQAQENSQNAINLLNVADAALSEISDRLIDIQESITFVLNGTATEEEIAAEQQSVDNNIAAIDRIASTTRYGTRPLLNGSAGYPIVSDIPSDVNDLKVRRAIFPAGQTSIDIDITVASIPERGIIRFEYPRANGDVTLRITGPRGTEDVAIASGQEQAGIRDAINNVAGNTGVFATVTGNYLYLKTEEFGATQSVRVEVISGELSGQGANDLTIEYNYANGAWGTSETGDFTAGEVVMDYGKNGIISFEGLNFTGVGREFSVLTSRLYFQFALNPDRIDDPEIAQPIVSGYNISTISVGIGGLEFQLNELPYPSDRFSVGIEAVYSSFLGFKEYRDMIEEAATGWAETIYKGGFLSSLKTGGANNLTDNPENADNIVKGATTQVSSLRGFIGSAIAGSIQPNVDQLSVHIENISASLSYIRDLDFAEETANFTKIQILFQSTVATLASANLIPQTVLALLT